MNSLKSKETLSFSLGETTVCVLWLEMFPPYKIDDISKFSDDSASLDKFGQNSKHKMKLVLARNPFNDGRISLQRGWYIANPVSCSHFTFKAHCRNQLNIFYHKLTIPAFISTSNSLHRHCTLYFHVLGLF